MKQLSLFDIKVNINNEEKDPKMGVRIALETFSQNQLSEKTRRKTYGEKHRNTHTIQKKSKNRV